MVAAQIGAAEAYHASLDRTLLYQIIDTTPAYGLTVANITSAIVALENSVAGTPQIKYNIYNSQGSSISNVDSNGMISHMLSPELIFFRDGADLCLLAGITAQHLQVSQELQEQTPC